MRMILRVGVSLGLLWTSFSACKHADAETQAAPDSTGTLEHPTAKGASNSWDQIEQAVVNPHDYVLLKVPSQGLEAYMTPGSEQQNIPANLQGIWWMDGNPLAPGNVTSFARMVWDGPSNRVLVQEYGTNNYTLNADATGLKSFRESANSNLCFEVQFNADYTHGQLIQVMKVPVVNRSAKIPSSAINYKMDLVADGDWLRTSWWGPKRLPDYHLRRIVDASGQRVEPAYSEFLKAAPAISYIPQKKPFTPPPGDSVSVDFP